MVTKRETTEKVKKVKSHIIFDDDDSCSSEDMKSDMDNSDVEEDEEDDDEDDDEDADEDDDEDADEGDDEDADEGDDEDEEDEEDEETGDEEDEEEEHFDGENRTYSTTDEDENEDQIRENEFHKKKSGLERPFPGFGVPQKEMDIKKLKKSDLQAFKGLDYAYICEFTYEMNPLTIERLVEMLKEHNIDVMTLLPKDSDPTLKTIFLGSFSPMCIFHALILKCAIKAQKIEEIAYVIALKSNEELREIQENYKAIYHVDIEEELENAFKHTGNHAYSVFCFDNYHKNVPEGKYDDYVNRLFDAAVAIDGVKLLRLLLKPTLYCARAILLLFREKYSTTLTAFLENKFSCPDEFKLIKLLHNSIVSPVIFYCDIIRSCEKSKDCSYILPYILIYLRFNGLKTVATRYMELYENIKAREIIKAYGELKPFVKKALLEYFNNER